MMICITQMQMRLKFDKGLNILTQLQTHPLDSVYSICKPH